MQILALRIDPPCKACYWKYVYIFSVFWLTCISSWCPFKLVLYVSFTPGILFDLCQHTEDIAVCGKTVSALIPVDTDDQYRVFGFARDNFDSCKYDKQNKKKLVVVILVELF